MDLEKIELALDRLDNCITSLINMTTLPDSIHVQALRSTLPEIAAEIRTAADLT